MNYLFVGFLDCPAGLNRFSFPVLGISVILPVVFISRGTGLLLRANLGVFILVGAAAPKTGKPDHTAFIKKERRMHRNPH